jgi:predicted nucleotidyltransferase
MITPMAGAPMHDVAPLLAAYRGLLEARFGERLLELVLFGSRARGDAEPDSDIDVCVVISGVDDDERAVAIDLAFRAWRATSPSGPLLSPLVWSEEERDERLRAGRRIALDVVRDGIPL